MEEYVHIVPLGWEVDRAVLPLKKMHAHRVYILCNPDSHVHQKHFCKMVEEFLHKNNIGFQIVKVDANLDLKGVMREVARLIQLEFNKGNRVYVNMSAAGKIGSIASSLATMAHLKKGGGALYHVIPEDYTEDQEIRMKHGLARGMKGEPIFLPLFDLRLPNLEGGIVLTALASHPKKQLVYKEIIELLRKNKVRGFEDAMYGKKTSRDVKNKLNITLNKRIIHKLHEESLIEIEKQGRSRLVKLTDSGEYMASLCYSINNNYDNLE